MKILVVDDSKVMRTLVIRNLRQAGFDKHEIEEAANGLEGLNKIRESKPDVVLCDWNMPEMNGYELLSAIKSEKINVIFGFVTSEGTAEMREKASESGAQFLITKPFTPDTFTLHLSKHLD